MYVELSSCVLSWSDITIVSAADVLCGGEGKSDDAIRKHHDNCDVLFQRNSDGSSNILGNKPWEHYVGCCELVLVHIACIQCLVWS